jgi:formimidoylglutamate deiminase
MTLFAPAALLPEGWARDVRIELDAAGRIANIAANSAAQLGDERLSGWLVPGMPNLHSHAFQRAMAGLAESRSQAHDSFWSWRDLMYRFASRLTPAQQQDIAAGLYVEMLKGGYTSVAEFHYLHHDVGGTPFDDPCEMSHRTVAAAKSAGIALTHLPVLYQHGGFGGKPASPGQARFIHSLDAYLRLVHALHARFGAEPDTRIGAAFHSLRAVDADSLRAAIPALRSLDATMPLHIHVAEQLQEVEACIAWSGRRPVRWLLDEAALDAHWCLVHATHMVADEVRDLAASGATAGLCPTTEANLGDGLFPAEAYLGGDRPGRFGIGSDSHVEVSVAAELRLLEYGQRLALGRRAVFATAETPSPGLRLYRDAALGGAQALGLAAGQIAPGSRADLVVLDPEAPAFSNKPLETLMDAWVFAGDAACVRDVMVGGRWRIRERHHADEERLARRFREAQAALVA